MKRWLAAIAASLAFIVVAVLGSPAAAGPSITVKQRVTEKNCIVTVTASYSGAYYVTPTGTWLMRVVIQSLDGTGDDVYVPMLKKNGRATVTFTGTARPAGPNETTVQTGIDGAPATAMDTIYPACWNWVAVE